MKTLIIPLEIKHREYLGGIILAYFALKNGWTVYFGQKSQIFPFINTLPKSIWYLKSIVPGEIQNLKKIKKYGHKITTLDIEGLILSNGKFGALKRYSEKTIELTDKIFFWGFESHFNPVYNVFNSIKNKSYVTGSPIVDSWKIEKNKINFNNRKYKNNILISVNFARADPKFKKVRKEYENYFSGLDNYPPKEINQYKKLLDNEYKLKELSYNHFKEIIPKLADKFNQFNIVVRPHPEENINFWKNFLKKYKNVSVNNQETTSKQLLECDYFIHFNSTMSVQSCFFEKYTIMYNPIKDLDALSAISPITNDVSIICHNENDLFFNILNPDTTKMKNKNIVLDKYIETSDSFSSIQIINEIDNIQNNNFDNNDKTNSLYSIYSYLNYHLKFYILFLIGFMTYWIPYFRLKYGKFSWRYKLGKKKWSFTTSRNIKDTFRYLFDDEDYNNKIKIKKHFSGFFKFYLK